MSQDSDSPDRILGEEFLTWLWYRSDSMPDSFRDANNQPYMVYMEQRIVVQGGNGQTRETASVSGCLSALREARVGLATGKKVSRALVRLEKDDLAFQFTVRAEDFNIGSLKTPKIAKEEDDEPDALLLEKIYLLEICMQLFDSLYAGFLKLRLSPQWEEEVARMEAWLSHVDGI